MQNLLYERNGIQLGAGEETCTHQNTERIPEKQPTCTEAGHHAYLKCKDCGKELSKNVIPAKGHSWKEATCTSPKTCTVCGAKEGSSKDHNWASKPACSDCGAPNPNWSAEAKPGANGTETIPGDETQPAAEPTAPSAGEATTEPTVVVTAPAEDETVGDIIGIGGDQETTTTTVEPDPLPKDGPCNPFSCGCWLYILIALVLGIVGGWFLNEFLRKQKMSKRRSRPYTEVDYNAAPAPAARTTASAPIPVAAPMAAAPVASGTGISAAVHQHIGARKDQQDSYGVSDLNAYGTNGVLAVVADGMGGLANGAAVSSTLVHSLLTYFRQTTGKENTADMMLDMVTQANDQINRMLQGADRSGSTLVSAIIREGRLHFLTVGDSRIYLYRKGVLLQLNREHIYQEELALKAVNHIVPLQQVTGDRQAHALTSYLGIGRLTHIDRNYDSIKLEPGDRLLLASDGVFGTLSEVDMENALRGTISQAAESMGQMILKANMPYQDNNTALVVEYRG